ncbi:MAG TPA: hypothetical protein VFA45_16745 [Actinomycetes bacterium]|jgi:hypothetical protein|nr:hypothetical protein [Actinomycetes bacterium]
MALLVTVELTAVIIAVTDDAPRILTVTGGAADGTGDALPCGPLDPEGDRTLGLGLRRWVREQTGLELDYIEQLYTFGDRDRDPGSGARALSVAYLALVREERPFGSGEARWRDWYGFFPWEDQRCGRPELLDRVIVPALERWAECTAEGAGKAAGAAVTGRQRRARVNIEFGLGGASWDEIRALERYELLYEAGLLAEAQWDGCRPATGSPGDGQPVGRPMVLDHRRIAATALSRLRGKLAYRPVVFELLPAEFTLLRLQQLVEALAGTRLHKQNFRRLVEQGRLVEGTGRHQVRTGGRPAELFRFRKEVLRERSRAGVALPGLRG